MKEGTQVVKKGQVEQVLDEYDGLRIKVRLPQDGNISLTNIPYCFPLLPKSFQVVPKVGEGALVLTTMSENSDSQRYYIGPIISQYQFNNECYYNYGSGEASSLIGGGTIGPLEAISNYSTTKGSFPEVGDVAMLGRGTQDIILRENKSNNSNEVDIRCGIRNDSSSFASNETNESNKVLRRLQTGMMGNIIFNNVDPAYIQLKYKKNITNNNKGRDLEANSVINLVADKVNIVSHQDPNHFSLTDNKELITESGMSEMMASLHQLPLGDKLIELLDKMIQAIYKHVHPQGGMPPSLSPEITAIVPYGWEKLYQEILSKHVRIS